MSRESLNKSPELRNWKPYCSLNLLLVISWIPAEIPVSLGGPRNETGCCDETMVSYSQKYWSETETLFESENGFNYPVSLFFFFSVQIYCPLPESKYKETVHNKPKYCLVSHTNQYHLLWVEGLKLEVKGGKGKKN